VDYRELVVLSIFTLMMYVVGSDVEFYEVDVIAIPSSGEVDGRFVWGKAHANQHRGEKMIEVISDLSIS